MTAKQGILPPLPSGWIWTEVENLCEVQTGPFGTQLHRSDYTDFGINTIEIGDVYPNRNLSEGTAHFISKEKAKQLTRYEVNEGDILFTRVGTVGRCTKVPTASNGWLMSTSLIRVRPKVKSPILSSFLLYYFLSPIAQSFAKATSKGTTRAGTNSKIVEQLPLAIAPINEQKRIVGKIEVLFSFLDAGVASLSLVQAQLKRYRQAILKTAFTGKLTQQWREKHKNQTESAQKVVEGINQDLKKTATVNSVSISNVNKSSLQQLPETWKWVTIGQIESFIGSGITPRGGRAVYKKQGIPFIRSQNVYPDGLRLEEIVYITPKIHYEMKRTKAYPNDVLLNITGASIGRSTVIPETLLEANVNQHVCIIRTLESVLSQYLSQFLNSPTGQDQIFGTQTGVTRQGLNYAQIRRLKIPLAPLNEQKMIVEKIGLVFNVILQIEMNLKQNFDYATGLRQSILKAAFKGSLVTQDSNDEPAEKLLELIKVQRLSNKSKNINQVELSEYVK